MYKYLVLAMILLVPASANAQETPDPWQPLRFLEGTWVGTGHGPAGESKVTQTFEFILEGNYLKATTRAEFLPIDTNLVGEVHEDLEIFSFDHGRNKHVLRGFYVEGFVNTFTLDTISDDVLIFNTIAVENGPPGTRARMMYEMDHKEEIAQSFWVAFPGKELACMVTNHLKKLK